MSSRMLPSQPGPPSKMLFWLITQSFLPNLSSLGGKSCITSQKSVCEGGSESDDLDHSISETRPRPTVPTKWATELDKEKVKTGKFTRTNERVHLHGYMEQLLRRTVFRGLFYCIFIYFFVFFYYYYFI